MKQKLTFVAALALGVFALTAAPLQADFVQCPVSTCDGTDNNDVINGTSTGEIINGLDGIDFISGNDGDDTIFGGPGNDILNGGQGSDLLEGQEGNDLLFPGPDNDLMIQQANGGPGNDVTTVFASEISYCLIVDDMGGSDQLNLVGFGPYSLINPFGQPGYVAGWIQFIDPIAGGEIWVYVSENDDQGIEKINGADFPSVAIQPSITGMCFIE